MIWGTYFFVDPNGVPGVLAASTDISQWGLPGEDNGALRRQRPRVAPCVSVYGAGSSPLGRFETLRQASES
jgi:hypothetical protein